MEDQERYLGDGLYASFDGWQIVLRAPRDRGDHYVALEPEVLTALQQFIAELGRKYPEFRERWTLTAP